ncbi:uncharacterized protein LOC107821308 [Nicotiana tabacum]|uniref:Uncharacterized protein LOC107821308 n=2 Tax=Nicotiana TaxID=4085 RepID=A0A1S4CQI4_TOBAC|nr:PREDICTED: uncharacterized protein LOC104220371 [Nicotiana sylvestris]XP_009769531.1 PREDICTED: uncharacterized protein LOC104220371 [Nicotiana sylvestris]XP_016503234.1 PREDICTED: uncharacterized protein LOC107821308 [Nicotiana tabacum]
MISEGNADRKWSEKKMEKEDGLRTVECLRGRLLAERAASRKAKEDAELFGNKLIVLENKLREETRSRNKAEKKLNFFIKKLEALNISYVSDESEHSSLLDKSEISSVTSTTVSNTKLSEDEGQKSQFTGSIVSEFVESIGSRKCSSENLEYHSQELISQQCEKKELIEKRISQENSINLEQNATQMTIFIKDDHSHSKVEQDLGKSSELQISNSDVNSLKFSLKEQGKNGEDETRQQEENVDYSLALVPVDLPKDTIDPVVLDTTVREVLDALRHAKEKLQTQMERRSMIKVG